MGKILKENVIGLLGSSVCLVLYFIKETLCFWQGRYFNIQFILLVALQVMALLSILWELKREKIRVSNEAEMDEH